MTQNKFLLFLFLGGMLWGQAQTIRPVRTGAPFLRISPDARAGGLGDMGVATSADVFSQYWNPSKYVFSEEHSGVGISYTPYLSKITNDVFLMNAAFHTYLGENERSALGASIYYFNIGQVDLTQWVAGKIQDLGVAKPNEFSFDLSYSLKLSDQFGMGVTGRYIRSDLFNNDQNANTSAANSFAVDLSALYQSYPFKLGDLDSKMRLGINISNIGPKLDYYESEDYQNFLPTNLRMGGVLDLNLDDANRLSIGTEINKLLVPTPSIPVDANSDGIADYYTVKDEGVISGIFSSLSDAPDGFSEELKEFTWALSGEYVFQDAFAFRAGYFHESEVKGARQYATLGAGLKYNAFSIDFSYLFPTNDINNALQNTLRFALTWNFGGKTFNSNY
ncbi:type IX secretion system outer membrane channel protein PorV [Candidatus Ornithobacterium hominis]|uniref:type IX secretion system outer membrane channel protein PorV n=1 Tax=Candidatus Ornithobacterium hominis TaxID=2497989 RepID=UPI0024BC1C3B|nr:type IX secretion system outer membrane channel protein PorV [Candidatus Ornithobacterium hominis]CAI9430157.1 type IX secretion system outer membrane channel protein PorV [Candidatus Ornithobacterium hominis]